MTVLCMWNLEQQQHTVAVALNYNYYFTMLYTSCTLTYDLEDTFTQYCFKMSRQPCIARSLYCKRKTLLGISKEWGVLHTQFSGVPHWRCIRIKVQFN